MRKIEIPRNLIYDLYVTKRKSLSQIGQLLNCSNVTVMERLKEYRIDRRTYFEANVRYSKVDFSGNLIEKAYLIGFRIGDLNVKIPKGSTVYVKTNTTKLDQVRLVESLFRRYGPVRSKSYYKTDISIESYLNKSFAFLVPKHEYIPNWILKQKRLFLAFLAGYTDAEGNIGVYSNRARFRVRTCDFNILKQIYNYLNARGIRCHLTLEAKPKKHKLNAPFWCVSCNEMYSLSKLFYLIAPYLRHGKRCKDLKIATDNIYERILRRKPSCAKKNFLYYDGY